MPLVAANQRDVRWAWVLALLITLAAGVLRGWSIQESLWIDELHSAWCAEGSLTEVAQRAAIGNQSPLFFWLEWLLIRALGPSEWSLRLPSLIAGSLLPLATFWLAQRWISVGTGLVAALLVAIDPLAIFYANEARPYALVQLLAVVHFAILLELIVNPGTRLRVAWIVTAALLFHLHYTAALLIPAEIVCFAGLSLAKPHMVQCKWTAWAMDILVVVALCLPAIGNLQAIFGRRTNWTFVEQVAPGTLLDWWPTALAGWFLAAALAIDRVFAPATANTEPRTNRLWLWGLLLLCWLCIPAGIAWIATQADFTRLFFPRYLAAIAPAAALVAAACISLAPWWWSRTALGVWIAAAALWSSGIVEEWQSRGRIIHPRQEDWRGGIAWLNERLESEPLPVLVWGGLIEANGLQTPHDALLDDYCLLPVTSLYPLNAYRGELFPLPLDEPGRLPQTAEMLMVHRGGAWLVVRGERKLGQRIASNLLRQLNAPTTASEAIQWEIGETYAAGKVQVVRITRAAPESGESAAPKDDDRSIRATKSTPDA